MVVWDFDLLWKNYANMGGGGPYVTIPKIKKLRLRKEITSLITKS